MSFWRLSDGSEPSLRCDGCGESTPITTHGLCPFCCDSGSGSQSENSRSEVEAEGPQSGPAKTGHRPRTV